MNCPICNEDGKRREKLLADFQKELQEVRKQGEANVERLKDERERTGYHDNSKFGVTQEEIKRAGLLAEELESDVEDKISAVKNCSQCEGQGYI